jgi:hypothetical protein
MAVRTFGDVNPPVAIEPVEVRADLEGLGGEVSVRSLDGRVARSFTLRPGDRLESRVRQIMASRGMWIVRLDTRAGVVSRLVAIQ